MPSTPRSLTALTVGALLLTACGSDGEAEPTTELSVVGTDGLAFDPEAFTVPVGQEATLELTSQGVEHDLVIEDAAEVGHAGDMGHDDHDDDSEGHAEDEHDLHVAHADAGDSVTATFQIDEPGSYEVYCSVPGHREAGMTATLEVADVD